MKQELSRMSLWRNVLVAPAMLLAACGPGLVGVTDDDDDDGSTLSAETTGDASSTIDGSTSDDSSSTSDETDPGFVPMLDQFVPDDCGPFAPNCPEGEKCVPYVSGDTWDASKCVPVMGAQATGEPCRSDGYVEATDDCDATGMCWNLMDVDGEKVGVCHAFCMGWPDDPICPDKSLCQISSDGPIALCIPTCNPLSQDCAAPSGCYWAGYAFMCAPTGNLPTGAPCGFINDCVPGNLCVDATVLPDCMGTACCTSFCNLEFGPGQCDAQPGTACMEFWEQGMAPLGYEQVGVCTSA
ncbi:hypothetical protein DB30_03239 [Enhygromyxa salina]|uniref:Uncharacterized protein n=1 Tax=Enhygromyxa salina TaxID=215803 RepID=A0A0C2A2B2_9BACT|nr:hypothetical protein [Enhygromyxa salina]KIG17538.1 hypothetical protein DB30_03239 [Enhygromyxa salina]